MTTRTGSRRSSSVTAVVVGVALLVGACSAESASPGGGSGDGTFTGLVEISGGRKIWLECQGSGSPTAVLVSGAAGAHDDWTHVADPAEPAGVPRPSASAVLPGVAQFTRVCAYDRPGTTLFTAALSPSDPVSQPTTAQAGAADLRALLAAAREPGPYVLVGASWGGMIVNAFARSNPTDVAGLVFVDGASEFLKETLTPQQWTAWTRAVETSAVSPGGEVPDYEAAVAEIRASAPMPDVPAVVVTAGKPWNLPVGDAGPTWPAWTAAQDRLAGLLHATHLTGTDSGHAVNIEQPAVVVGAVREVVDAARGAQ
jgi:pimeloyl-ACP methyl ester carboxylesterase